MLQVCFIGDEGERERRIAPHAFFDGDAQSWLNLQAIYDLRRVEVSSAKAIKAEVEPCQIADFVQA